MISDSFKRLGFVTFFFCVGTVARSQKGFVGEGRVPIEFFQVPCTTEVGTVIGKYIFAVEVE